MNRTYRRVGLIGDIHADDQLLECALDFFDARRVEIVLSTGDVADGPGSVDKCCHLLRARNVATVRGNHDRWLLAGTGRDLPEATPAEAVSSESRRLLEGLPEKLELETIRGRALLCHGLGTNDMAKVNPDDFGYALEANDDLQKLLRGRLYRWILNGHSHRRMVREFQGVTVVNAGSIQRHLSPCLFELDFESSVAWLFEVDATGRIGLDAARIPLHEYPPPICI